jgi:P27 family predicted phage terminase small subunit
MSKRGPKPAKNITLSLAQDWSAAGRGLSSAAKAAFVHYVDLLRQRGNLDSTDVELVVAAAQTVEARDVAYKQLQKDGAFVENDKGNVVAHPAVRVHAEACQRLKAIDSELGLTPTSGKIAAAQGVQRGSLDYFQALAAGHDS